MEDNTECVFSISFFVFIFTTPVVRIEPQATMGDPHLLLDDYAVHPNFLYAHTLELAALSINVFYYDNHS